MRVRLLARRLPGDRPRSADVRRRPLTRPTPSRHVAVLMRAAGIEGPQDYATPTGVTAVAAGVPLPTVAAVLGHLTTAALYVTAVVAETREFIARV